MNLNKPSDYISNSAEFAGVLKKWLEDYVQNGQEKPKEWLEQELAKNLQGTDAQKASDLATEIVAYVDSIKQANQELQDAKDRGMTSKEWLYRKLKKSAKDFTEEEFGNLVGSLGNSVLMEFQDAVNNFDAEKNESSAKRITVIPDTVPPKIGWNDANIKDRALDTVKVMKPLAVLGLSKLGLSENEVEVVLKTSDYAQEIADSLLKDKSGNVVKALAGALTEASDKKLLNLDKIMSSVPSCCPTPYSPSDVVMGKIPLFDGKIPSISVLADNAHSCINLATKVVTGDLHAEDAVNFAVDRVVSVAGGVAEVACSRYGGVAGASIGGFIGSVIPGLGTAVGAEIGGMVGSFLGTKVAQPIKKGINYVAGKAKEFGKKVVDGVCSAGKAVWNGVKSVASGVCHAVSSFCSSVGSFFSGLFS